MPHPTGGEPAGEFPLRRGDIVTVADRSGEFTGKPRPTIVLQNPLFYETATVAVCPVTSLAVAAPALRISVVADAATGLEQPSWAMIDRLGTIRRRRIGRRIGRLDDATLLAIDRALVVFLGIAK
jgi:mRNA interferase MazF